MFFLVALSTKLSVMPPPGVAIRPTRFSFSAGIAAGADSAGVAGSASSAAGVVAEVVAGRRPPELVVVMSGFVLFWTEVFFVDFLPYAQERAQFLGFLAFCLVCFLNFWIFFVNFALPAIKSPRKPLSVVQCFCGDWGVSQKVTPARRWCAFGALSAGWRRADGWRLADFLAMAGRTAIRMQFLP